MKDSLKPGLTGTRQFAVDEPRTISFMGDEGRVYATPSMVRDVEQTCRDWLLDHLDDGEDSVGTRVEINHIAATPLGMDVVVEITLAKVDKRAVRFDFTVRDSEEEVGNGSHSRFVIDTASTFERMKAKIGRAKGS